VGLLVFDWTHDSVRLVQRMPCFWGYDPVSGGLGFQRFSDMVRYISKDVLFRLSMGSFQDLGELMTQGALSISSKEESRMDVRT
jgi:hypothetical protein